MNIKNTKYAQYFLILFFSICIVSACKFFKKEDTKIEDKSIFFKDLFTENKNSIFRNINLKMNQTMVKKQEKIPLYEATSDHLFYEFTYKNDSSQFQEYANIQYFFDEKNELDIITTDIFLNDSLQEIKLLNTLNQYYDTKFGSTEQDDYGYNIWNGTDENDIEFTLGITKLESPDYGLKIEISKK